MLRGAGEGPAVLSAGPAVRGSGPAVVVGRALGPDGAEHAGAARAVAVDAGAVGAVAAARTVGRQAGNDGRRFVAPGAGGARNGHGPGPRVGGAGAAPPGRRRLRTR